MAWAKEMRNLAADIKSSHRDRTQYVKDVKDDTHELIARFQRELKEMARDLKDFLAKSENTRKKDFEAMIKTIWARVKDIKEDTADLLAKYDKEMKDLAADLKDFLKKSETTRMADFKAMMKDIRETVGGIEKSTRALLGDYKAERKEAAGYWAGLRGRRTVEREEVSEAPKKKKKKKIKMFSL